MSGNVADAQEHWIRVIIATDDMRIANAAFDWGAEVALTSPKHQSGTDRIAEVVRRAKQFAFIINIQGDEPLVDPRLIDKLVKKLRSDRKIDIVTAAHPFANAAEASSPHQVKVVVDLGGNALYFSRFAVPFPRDRSVPVKYLRHQGIYGFRRKTLLQFVKWKPTPLERAESLEQLRALENGVKVHVLVTKHGSPGVDTPADAKALEQKLARAKRRSFPMKYIFVTGGVVSSLGKGLAAASLGTLLEARGLRVVFQKFDPYLNVDPGTMNPFQHGEVYVLNDGAETDLDLGHYERFTNCVLSRHNNLTSGQVYESRNFKRTPRRLSRQNRAGDSARHRCNQRPHPRTFRRKQIRRRHHRDRRNDRRHRRPAISRSDPAIHSRSRPGKRGEHSRHARAVHQSGGRIENETDATKRRKVARDRFATAGADLPHRETARPRRAAEIVDVLQRF